MVDPAGSRSMNAGSTWRLAFVRRASAAYAANPQVAAILLGGSTARGQADRYSDIELGVFWRQPPGNDERLAAIRQSGGDLLRLYPYDPKEEVWCDDLMLGRKTPEEARSGVLVEVIHSTVDSVQHCLDAVLQQFDPDENKQSLIASVVDGLALHNPALIDEWKARAARYPDELALAVVEHYALIDHFWRWQMWLERGPNLMMLYQTFSQMQRQVLHMLLGINHVYYFGFKWIESVAARLLIAPPQLTQRLQAVYQVPPTQDAGILADLVEETYTLVEQHLPQIDVTWLRTVFRYQRPFWEAPPPA